MTFSGEVFPDDVGEPKVTLVFGDITCPRSDPSQGDETKKGVLRLGALGGHDTKRSTRSQGSESIQMAFTRSIPQ